MKTNNNINGYVTREWCAYYRDAECFHMTSRRPYPVGVELFSNINAFFGIDAAPVSENAV